jgi:uncharacterized paraquat-inducible protein A
MNTFPRLAYCRSCRASFDDMTGRCPDCHKRTAKGRKAVVRAVVFGLLTVVAFGLAVYVVMHLPPR